MQKLDQRVVTITVLVVSTYLLTAIAGIITGLVLYFICILNICVALCILAWWIQKELKRQQHFMERRELITLILEVLVIAAASISLITSTSQWLTVFEYAVFGLHFFALTCFLFFMLLFKVKKLI